MIAAVFGLLADGRTRWRRARNLRAGARTPSAPMRRNAAPAMPAAAWAPAPKAAAPAPLRWLTLAALLLALGGAVLIALHARWMALAGAEGPDQSASALRGVLPGAAFHVP